ncbi:hypothetical protein [Pimelobacter simplex]|uniref:hypothetical protein n=1 Tax=Nocardioides simplex TaxID=2045 RepID=UPI0021502BA4|nr:hypothetical protein [Pimelobacter simplex]UUW87403.1 hypothetical protein M0M43_16810 [Pimelobacter simplex]UUW96908.1 hypothetical protein M0M48_05455 [Pimelobacter simplex]
MTVLTLPDARAHLNITDETAPTTAKLTAMIASAESAIAGRVGPLEAQARTVRVAPNYKTLVVLSPAVEVTAVTDSVGTTLDTAALHLNQRAGLITRSDGSAFTASWYDVTYDYGRSPCPPDLVLAVKEMVRHLWDTQRGPSKRPGSNTSDATSNTIPGAAYLLPFRVAELIAPHRPALVAG